MWILPQNLRKSYLSVPECEDSNWGLNEQASQFSQSVTWKSKHLSSKIWSSKWKKVYWLKHLFSATLPNSLSKNFVEKYTESLADIPVNRFPTLDFDKVQTILDTFGRLTVVALKNRGLWASSSKMSKDTYRLAYATYLRTYENLVTRWRLDYSARQKSELPTDETGSLFSGWKTPSSSECEGGVLSKGKIGDAKYKLRDQVSWPTPDTGDIDMVPSVNVRPTNRRKGPKNFHQAVNWATPDVSSDGRNPKEGWTWNGTHWIKADGSKVQTSLKHQTEHWATPNTRDHKGKSQFENQESLPNQVSLNSQDWPTPTISGNNNSKGSSEKSGNGLSTEAKQWGTPRVTTNNGMGKHRKDDKSRLEDQVWPTASARDWRSGKSNQHEKNARPLNEVVMKEESWPTPTFAGNNNGSINEWGGSKNKMRGRPDLEKTNIRGKQLGLNPAWVMQLMGTTIAKTFFAWRETPLYLNSQKKPSEPCS